MTSSDVLDTCFNLQLKQSGEIILYDIDDLLKEKDAEDIKIIAGGIIPDEEIPKWNEMGIEAIFGPGSSTKDIIKYIDGKNIE